MRSRKALVSAIHALAEPHFHDSGYNKHLDPSKGIFGPKRPLRLWAPAKPIEINGFAFDELLAISEDGVFVDAHAGGAMQWGYGCFPVEDLRLIHEAVKAALTGQPSLSQQAQDPQT